MPGSHGRLLESALPTILGFELLSFLACTFGEVVLDSLLVRLMSAVDDDNLVSRRMSFLLLAQALGNVSKACTLGGISRTHFYELRRRFQSAGLAGLRASPPIHRSHPMTTPDHVVDRVLQVSLANPCLGMRTSAAGSG